ncbi:MAG: O-antigen ligase family protein [Nitrospiraceae bacterium]
MGAILGASILALSTKALALLLAGMAGAVMATSSAAAYYALVASIPVQVDFLGGLTITKLVVPAVLAIVAMNALIRRGPWPPVFRGPEGFLACTFFLASLVSLLVQGLRQFPGEAAKVPVYASLFFLTLTFNRTPADFRRLLWVLAVAGTIEALVTAAQVRYGFVMPGDWRRNLGQPGEGGVDGALDSILGGKIRAEGTTAHPIFLASYFLMTIPCTTLLLLQEHHPARRMLLGTMLALMGYAWFYTFARSSMIGFAVMAVVTLNFYSRAARIMTLLGLLMSMTGLLSYQVISESVSSGVRVFESQSFWGQADVNAASGSWQFRLESIVGGWNLFLAYPWFGVGFGQSIWNYMPYLPSWATHSSHPSTIHNTFLEVGSELGIFALVTFIGIWLWGFLGIRRALQRPETRHYAILMCSILSGQMTFVMITPMVREIWLTIPMAIALGYMHKPETV